MITIDQVARRIAALETRVEVMGKHCANIGDKVDTVVEKLEDLACRLGGGGSGSASEEGWQMPAQSSAVDVAETLEDMRKQLAAVLQGRDAPPAHDAQQQQHQ